MATIFVVLQSGLKYWLNIVTTTVSLYKRVPRQKNFHTLEKTYFAHLFCAKINVTRNLGKVRYSFASFLIIFIYVGWHNYRCNVGWHNYRYNVGGIIIATIWGGIIKAVMLGDIIIAVMWGGIIIAVMWVT